MTIRRALAVAGLATIAACGAHNGAGDNTTTNGITSEPKANAVCSSMPGTEICGPNGVATDAPPDGATGSPSASPTATSSTHCRHHRHHRHRANCPHPTPSQRPTG
jgi:hypothetical protein